MKTILEALGKALEGLLSASTLWFAVVIAAITSVVLLLYGNNKLLWGIGCQSSTSDLLGICNFIKNNQNIQKWIGLIALIAIIMLIIGGLLWTWQKLKPSLFPNGENNMNILEKLGKAIQGLFSANNLRFAVNVAALTCVFLLLYYNDVMPWDMGCTNPEKKDPFAICDFIGKPNNHTTIGLIAIISVIMLIVGSTPRVWQQLKPILFPAGGNPLVKEIAIIIIIIGGLLWVWQQPWPYLLVEGKSEWVDLIAIIMIIGGGLLWAWQMQRKRYPAKGDV